MAKILFVTDSAADIPPALQEKYSIRVLPFPVEMNGQEYLDGVDYTPDEFYAQLLAAPQIPTHSQLNPFVFMECFEEALAGGCTDLIYTSINAKGSATYQNALQARDSFYEDHPEARESLRIQIIDSRTYTMGYGWAVVRAAELVQGGADAQAAGDLIRDWVDHVHVVFSPLDLHFAKKSGRISAAAAFVGEALGLKPVMTFQDGESRMLAKCRGEKAVIAQLAQLCKTEKKPGTPWLLIRSGLPEQAAKLLELCTAETGEAPAMEFPIGGVIAINAGPSLIGVVYRS